MTKCVSNGLGNKGPNIKFPNPPRAGAVLPDKVNVRINHQPRLAVSRSPIREFASNA